MLSKKEALEIEEIDESGEINRPFDPNEIKIDTKQLTIQHIIERLEFDEINLFTEFQRSHNLWDDKKQSRLIESILLNMPLPSFYFDGEKDDIWQVVDGLQRVSTIKNFIVDKKLSLQGLEFLKQFEGQKYNDLSRDLQRRIKSFTITVYVIKEGTPEQVKYILFSRINTAGMVLFPQEIRHALNQGVPADFVKKLAKLSIFQQATTYSIKADRMADRDFVNRFIAFYLIGHDKYEPDLHSFLNLGMAKLKKISEDELKELEKAFIQANELAIEIFDKDAYRKRFAEGSKRKPINKALFDALSVNLARLNHEKVEMLKEKKVLFKNKIIQLMLENDDFLNSITSGTGQKEKARTRYKAIKNILDEILK